MSFDFVVIDCKTIGNLETWFETKTWLTKANKRNLLKQFEYEQIVKKIDALGVKLNNYINSIGRNNK